CVTDSGCRATARELCEEVGFCTPVVFKPGFDGTAGLSQDGREIAVSGPIDCTAGERIEYVRVTVTQDGAVAEGETSGRICTGSNEGWAATAHAEGRASFGAGEAKVCGLATLGNAGDTLATFQWCRDITLVVK